MELQITIIQELNKRLNSKGGLAIELGISKPTLQKVLDGKANKKLLNHLKVMLDL
jgi:predicted DNA binding protein